MNLDPTSPSSAFCFPSELLARPRIRRVLHLSRHKGGSQPALVITAFRLGIPRYPFPNNGREQG